MKSRPLSQISVATGFLFLIIIGMALILGWTSYFFIKNVLIVEISQSETEKIHSLRIKMCKYPDASSNEETVSTFSREDDIYLCGFFDADEEVALTIYWIELSSDKVVYQNSYGAIYSPGYFFDELKVELEPGFYRVEVYYHRIKLDEIDFLILE